MNENKKPFNSIQDNYGDKYIEHLLDQYKMYVGGSEKISDRRQKTNEFFLGLNTALVALLGFIATKDLGININLMFPLSSVAGIVICYLWYRIVCSYKGLNDAKFKVIHKIEERLPLSLYDTEWDMLGRGEDNKLYWPFSHIELHVPKIFIIIYSILIIFIVNWAGLISVLNFPEVNLSVFNIVSMTSTFLGSLAIARGLFISKKKAIELGVSRWSGDTDEENLKLPQVKDRISQKKWGIIGASFITIGFILQLIIYFI
jgi:hypothetical protein